MSAMKDRACLMRFSAGMPGESRKDAGLTETVKAEKGMSGDAGKWLKTLYPPEALEPLKKIVNEARQYHATVTLPFDNGIGILPATLIVEYGDKMREFAGKFTAVRESHFIARLAEWIDWARQAHNGSFDESLYGTEEEMRKKFYFKTEPLPVPDCAHFEGTVSSLLGVDAESVNVRVASAAKEAQRELMRRIIEPVKAMAEKLGETPKVDKKTGLPKEDIVFRDSLVGNVQDIVRLAPKLNLADDPEIAVFCRDMEAKLCRHSAEELRKSKTDRDAVKANAAELLAKLEAYKI